MMLSQLKLISTQWRFAAYIVCLVTMIAGCSGSLESKDTEPNSPDDALRVALGDDKNLPIGSGEVEINSTVTGINPPFTYMWSAQPEQYNSALSETDTANITFTLPDDQTQLDSVLLTLKVIDANGQTANDQIILNIISDNTLPIIDLTVDDSDRVIDSGKGFSFDATWLDAEDGELVQSAKIRVEQISGVSLTGLPDDGIIADFPIEAGVTPALGLIADGQLINWSSQSAILEFRLEVTDTNGGVSPKSITIDILPENRSAPVVDAGHNLVVYQQQSVTLTGTVSNGQNNEFLWTQTSGDIPLDIAGTDKARIQFQAPDVAEASHFELKFTAKNLLSERRNSDFVTVTVLPISMFDGINDTGITRCADGDSNNIAIGNCPGNYPNQDAEIGRDRANLNGELAKNGEGELGFDFDLINDSGEEINSGTPACIRDNVTGLIWEIKTDSGIRSHTHTFTWYQPGNTNGGDEGVSSSPTDADIQAQCFINANLAECNTQAYVNAVNAANLCGGDDWRLPTVKELISILNYGEVTDKLALGADETQLWPNHAKVDTPYWTKTSSLFGVSNPATPNAPRAWAVNLSTGNEESYKKRNAAAVLLVRE
ncbi:DUF1566 domain-containing protein [Catenovulum adriaticum]|uniref:DUF1566 domain-containing protein n=1 Tax=Catenovulum adriaticum TaxID=2984846 RepID=A0ABY7ARB4_9ALTE|nr:DUF1566 domain-containing protein [Catenovulum sp. TS8]WAJ72074.1 DUF1566 domain-containing protein [Catenovulum sp. TS8]